MSWQRLLETEGVTENSFSLGPGEATGEVAASAAVEETPGLKGVMEKR